MSVNADVQGLLYDGPARAPVYSAGCVARCVSNRRAVKALTP